VIAARNEADNIGETVRKASRYGDVIVVDDASEDTTASLAQLEGAVIVHHDIRTHVKQAFVDGFRFALKRNYQHIIQMDAGLSHDPDEIPRLLRGLDPAAMVIGSRFIPGAHSGQNLWRRLLSRGGTLLVRAVTGMPFSDVTSGFRAFDAGLLRDLDEQNVLDGLQATAHAFQFELLWQVYQLGYDIREVSISYQPSKSSLRINIVVEALRTLVRLAVAK